MSQIGAIMRELLPEWMLRRKGSKDFGDHRETPDAHEADRNWRRTGERGLYGANTPDYADLSADKKPAKYH